MRASRVTRPAVDTSWLAQLASPPHAAGGRCAGPLAAATTEVAIDTAPLEGLDLRLTGMSRNPGASQGGEANEQRYDGSGKL